MDAQQPGLWLLIWAKWRKKKELWERDVIRKSVVEMSYSALALGGDLANEPSLPPGGLIPNAALLQQLVPEGVKETVAANLLSVGEFRK